MKYKLIRSKRRKKSLSIRVNNDLEVVVRAPLLTSMRTIDKFVHKHISWINKSISRVQKSPYKSKLSSVEFKIKKSKLDNYLAVRLPILAKELGVTYNNYVIKNITSYWGQCTKDNKLSFNANLADFSDDTVDYVIIHELAHTRIKNHSSSFWSLVEKYCPQYKNYKKLLKSGGLETI